ncbi:hypothetical protein [Brevundimonas sp.]|uniref:hypothetical protein n=1 Tax=Brevundimonas sp. TaxID=1871086 RepID=UPI003AF516DD
MTPPPAFRQLCQGLHQDAPLSSGGALARHCLAFVTSAERPALSVFLDELSARSDADLKGVFNRGATDLAFDSRQARAFLEDLLAVLRKR